ncbi:uncharacterized protein LOC124165602 [Ischnura elegans]|uniref:uncharacterized protein LOC124165602 n=1 Tax=Ischnura elegans TaxID=197161 RepID=UPI001ED8BF85|nr:uncharacterized protein LOC124165602 [Ischnura elegans]
MHARNNIPGMMEVCSFAALVFLTALIDVSSANDKVYLRSHDGRSTVVSLNLRWVNGDRGSKPSDTVCGTLELTSGHSSVSEADEDTAPSTQYEDTYICRALHHDIWLPGHLNASSTVCTVSQDGSVFGYSTYQVLQNEGGATKLSWVYWDRKSGPYSLHQAVDVDGTGTYYVARREDKTPEEEKANEHTGIGKLDLRERSNYVAVAETRTPQDGPYRRRDRRRNFNVVPGEVERIYVSGKVLVAVDPKSYEMSIVEVGREPREVQSQQVMLATGKLVNNRSSSEEDEVNCVLSYESKYTVNWEQARGIVNGLPVNVLDLGEDMQQTMQGRETTDQLMWGQPMSWELQEEKRVKERLPSGTAANVTLVASKIMTETECLAQVTIYYGDGTNTSRKMNVMRKMEKPDHFHVEVGPAYFLGNGTLVKESHPDETTTTVPPTTPSVPKGHPNTTDGTSCHHEVTGTGNISLHNFNDKGCKNSTNPHGSSQSHDHKSTSTYTVPTSTERAGKKFEYETVTDAHVHKKEASSASQARSQFLVGIPSAMYGIVASCIIKRMLRT